MVDGCQTSITTFHNGLYYKSLVLATVFLTSDALQGRKNRSRLSGSPNAKQVNRMELAGLLKNKQVSGYPVRGAADQVRTDIDLTRQ